MSGIVLIAAVNVVGLGHVHRDGVKFSGRDIIEVQPVQPMVTTLIHSPVISQHQPVRFRGIDPQRMLIQMQGA